MCDSVECPALRTNPDPLTAQMTAVTEVKPATQQKRFNRLAAPMETAIKQLAEEVELLVREKREIEKWEGVEERVRVALARYADSLNQPDQEGLQRLMRLLNIQVVMIPGRALVTGLLDPSLFTIGRTLASPHERSRRCRWA